MPVRYEFVQDKKFLVTEAKSIGDYIRVLEENLRRFERWQEKGIKLDRHLGGGCCSVFYTYNEQVAREEGFSPLRGRCER